MSLCRLILITELMVGRSKWLSALSVVYLAFMVALSGHETVNSLAAPLCNLPVIGQFPYCPQISHFAPNFPELASLQNRLETVMKESISSSIVAVDIKRSELAVRDL